MLAQSKLHNCEPLNAIKARGRITFRGRRIKLIYLEMQLN